MWAVVKSGKRREKLAAKKRGRAPDLYPRRSEARGRAKKLGHPTTAEVAGAERAPQRGKLITGGKTGGTAAYGESSKLLCTLRGGESSKM